METRALLFKIRATKARYSILRKGLAVVLVGRTISDYCKIVKVLAQHPEKSWTRVGLTSIYLV